MDTTLNATFEIKIHLFKSQNFLELKNYFIPFPFLFVIAFKSKQQV